MELKAQNFAHPGAKEAVNRLKAKIVSGEPVLGELGVPRTDGEYGPMHVDPDNVCLKVVDVQYDEESKLLTATVEPHGPFGKALKQVSEENISFSVRTFTRPKAEDDDKPYLSIDEIVTIDVII